MIFHILRCSAGSCYLVEEGETNRFEIGATLIGTVDLDIKPPREPRKKVIKWRWVYRDSNNPTQIDMTVKHYQDETDYRLSPPIGGFATFLFPIRETAKEMYEDEH